jgi:hypothetical protein
MIALLRRFQNRLPESRIEWQRAIELDPNNAAASASSARR